MSQDNTVFEINIKKSKGGQSDPWSNTNKMVKWAKYMFSGVSGVMLGGGATLRMRTGDSQTLSSLSFGDTNDDNGSIPFPEAFQAARKQMGPGGVFEWNGELYTTFTADEWDQLDTDAVNEFLDHFEEEPDCEVETEDELVDIVEDESTEDLAQDTETETMIDEMEDSPIEQAEFSEEDMDETTEEL